MKNGFTVHHNGPPANCLNQPHARCERFWDGVKRYHGEKFGAKWAATSLYSFGVCPHGIRFVGCGWDKNQAANGKDVVGPYDGHDSAWYTVIVFLGTDEKPTIDMVIATKALIAEGRDSRRCGLRVLPHNAFKVKACPGPEFTKLAKEWDDAPFTAAPAPAATPAPRPATSPKDDVMTPELKAYLDRIEMRLTALQQISARLEMRAIAVQNTTAEIKAAQKPPA
jgi:hypothetical protein